MAITGPFKKILPIFTKEDEQYESYSKVKLSAFTEDPDYFWIDSAYDQARFFDSRYFYDLLFAPLYVLQKTSDRTFTYSSVLPNVFFKLYPDPRLYEKVSLESLPSLNAEVTFLSTNWPEKHAILSNLSSLQKVLGQKLQRIDRIAIGKSDENYLLVSKKILKEVIVLIEKARTGVLIQPSKVIKYRYYSENPTLSWIENPLAFFIYWSSALNNYPSLHTFRQEASISVNKILDRIDSLHDKKKQQRYIDNLCGVLNILYSNCDYDAKDAYKIIAYRTAKEHPQVSFTIDFPYNIEEEPLLRIETRKFIRDVFSLKLKDRWDNEYTLFNTLNTRMGDVSSLISGDIESVKHIEFNWPPESCQYFIMKLKEAKAKFRIADLERKNPVPILFLPILDFSSQKKSFTRGSHDVFKSHYKKNKITRTPAFDLIDSLFS